MFTTILNKFKQKDYKPHEDILYFLHIPKTGGTTLTTFLNRHFKTEETFPEQLWYHLLPKWPFPVDNIRFIRGHFGRGISKIFQKPVKNITMLRDPIERTISQFHHMHSIVDTTDDSWVPDDFMTKETTLKELVFDDERGRFFYNAQARYIALNVDAIAKNEGSEEKYYFDIDKEFLGYNTNVTQLKTDAEKVLNQMPFFGILEEYNMSMLLLCYKLNWEPEINLDKMMVKPGRPKQDSFDNETIDKIKSLTEIDQYLYDKYKKIFYKEFDKMVNSLKKKFYTPAIASKPKVQQAYEMLLTRYNRDYAK